MSGPDASALPFCSLIHLLRSRVCEAPDVPVFSYLADSEGGETVSLTRHGLGLRVRALAARLQRAGLRGRAVLLLFPPGLEFVVAFFGCIYAGVVAIPAYLPRPNRPLNRLRAIVEDSEPAAILTCESQRRHARRWPEGMRDLKSIPVLFSDAGLEDLAAEADGWSDPGAEHGDLAFLQYTSGSTADPKGVMISHGNLLDNSRLIQACFDSGPGDRGVFWLPLFHDMGLIGGVIQTIYCGGQSTLLSPVSFLQRPLRWLQAISRTGATISGGPNFAYDLCVERTTAEQRAGLDLSRWRVAFNGAEPIRPETLDRFAAAFEPYGFRREAFLPCYGLAEATLLVAGKPPGSACTTVALHPLELARGRARETSTGGAGRAVASSGAPVPGHVLAIVDPATGRPSPQGDVGEIWVSGPSVSRGYWNRPDETRERLEAKLDGHGDARFLRTGDLGFLKDGELFVTGRLKDLIVLRGRNVYPEDIELTVERSHPALRPRAGAAFAVDSPWGERLVVVQESERIRDDRLRDEIFGAIRHAIALDHEIEVSSIVLIEPLSLPRTSSGKVQRHACREGFLDGTLKVRESWTRNEPDTGEPTEIKARVTELARAGEPRRSCEDIASWLCEKVAGPLGVSPSEVDRRRPLGEFGIGSLQAVRLAGELERWLGRTLSPVLIYQYPTIESLAGYLAGESSDAAAEPRAPARDVSGRMPIAIVGIGCRFPGASGPDAYWEMLRSGREGLRPLPASRWDEATSRRMRFAGRGGFLDDVEGFDAEFFRISPREAEFVDPQQRLLLEVTWEALEDAGQVPSRLVGTRVGVFVGIGTTDYAQLQAARGGSSDAYRITGNVFAIAANRISYAFDFRGPSIAVDTACSSSLVSVHLACRSLWDGESSLALAGGVNVILSPEIMGSVVRLGVLSPDGRCWTFDERANGYARGEGAGMVVLKPLDRALADGDPIYALIRGTAVNQDGRTNGLTVPSAAAQEAVLREAYRQAGIDPADVDYIEAHGTGTLLGDPIEVSALGAVLSEGRPPDRRCALSSAKTNMGHLEAAAGIAGLIKAALALHHRAIPPSLNFARPNPHIPFDSLPLRVQTELCPWPAADRPGLAGVNSFGFGGTNAHAVLEEAPRSLDLASRPIALTPDEDVIVPLSARCDAALRSLVGSFHQGLVDRLRNVPLADIAYTAAVRREHHEHRFAPVVATSDGLREELESYLEGGTSSSGRPPGPSTVGRRGGLVFVFSGQGGLWEGVGRDLYEREDVFRRAIDDCGRWLSRHLSWSLRDCLMAGAPGVSFGDPEIAQPLQFAIQVALAALWKSWGIVPDAVVGHSLGEIAAAHVAGALSLEDAARIVALRGRAMKAAAGRGGMVAVALAPDEVRRRIEGLETELCIGAINGPASVTVSGDTGSVERFASAMRATSSPPKILDVNIAFHGPHMDTVRRDLEAALDGLCANPASVHFVSTVTGEELEGAKLDAAYWGRNVREPVLFAAAMKTLSAGPYETYLELGPHPVLAPSIMDCLASRDSRPTVLASLRRGRPGRGMMLRSLSALYVRGFEVDWSRVCLPSRVVSLPTYPWQHERYWFEESRHADEREDLNPATLGDGSPAGSLFPGANGHAAHRMDAPARSRAGHVDHDQLLYVVSWERAERQIPAHVSFEGYWLILGNGGGMGERLRDQIQRRGGASRIIEARSLDPLDGPGAGDAERFGFFRSMLEETRRAGTTIRGVVFLEGLDHEGDRVAGLGGFEAAYRAPLANLLHVARALAASRTEDQPRLWVVTRGAQCAGGGASSPSLIQSALWGMGRSIAKELPGNWGGLIDLDPDCSSEEAVALAETIGEIGEEDQFAYRRQKCYVPRLVPMPAEERNGRHVMVVRPGGTYLITGGLGALGLEVARYLVERGARRLVLLGRKALPERTAWETLADESPDRARVDAVRALEEEGASVMAAAVDVGDAAAMRSLFEQLERTWPPLRGVVHAAGVVEPLPIEQMDLDRMLPTLRPKIAGTWLLHELTARAPIDFFLLFSSVSSIWGSPRQVDYTAANAFLDAMAQHRRSLGLPALSINWGPWAEIGMASLEGRNEALAKIGVRALSPTTALESMDRLAGSGATQVAVIDVDWPLFKSLHGWSGRGRLLDRVGAEGAGPGVGTGRHEAGRRGLLDWPVEDRPGRLIRHICQRASGVLRLPPEKVDPDRPLLSFGLDSLTAMELKNVIESDLNLAMPLALLLQGASIREMATELCSAVREVRDETPAPSGPPVAEIDHGPPRATATAANGDTERIVRIGHIRRDGLIPASFAQQRLWYLDQLDPGDPSYNIPTAVRLEGRLDRFALQRALDELIRRHEALRTTFGSEDGVPHQVIAPGLELPLLLEDLSSLDGEERARLAELRTREQAEAPFDLAHGPLIRAKLLRLSEREHDLLLTVHHIVADGWSVGLLIRELTALYEACRTGESRPLPELPVQYADFAAWQHDRVRGELLRPQLEYWTRRLAGLEDLELPTDRPRPTVFSHRGGERSLVISQFTVESLRALGSEECATLFMTLLAAFQVLLHRYSGQADLAVGTPIAGRALSELEGLIGLFLNTLVIRADLSGDPGFREVLRRVRDSAVEAYSHQDVPFEMLVSAIRPDGGTSRSPLFRAMFVTQKGPLPPLESPELVLTPLETGAGGAKFDLTLYAFELPEGMRLTMEYSADLFDASTIDGMLAHYRNLLEDIIVHPEEPIGSLAMLSDVELTRLLGQGNGTASHEHGVHTSDEGGDDLYGPFEDLSSSEVMANE